MKYKVNCCSFYISLSCIFLIKCFLEVATTAERITMSVIKNKQTKNTENKNNIKKSRQDYSVAVVFTEG